MRAVPRRSTGTLAMLAALVTLLATMAVTPAAAAPPPPAAPAAQPAAAPAGADPSTVQPDQRDRVLPAGWRTSTDLAWTTSGDPTGFHLLVAEASTGYTWRTAATLVEPGFDTDRWIGNACITASGRRAVVVYAPRHFTNRAHLFGRGAFAAVVDLASGKVTKLGAGVTLAYYNPGCGAAEAAVLTSSGAADLGRTRLHLVDTAKAAITRRQEFTGQITSAVPLGDEIAAAGGGGLVAIDAAGTQRTLARTTGVPFNLHPDAAGGVAFMQRQGDTTAMVNYLAGGTVRELGRGPLTGVGLVAGTGGQVFMTGSVSGTAALPGGVRRVTAPAHTELSTLGQVMVTHADPAALSGAARLPQRSEPDTAKPVALRATVLSSGQRLDFKVNPAGRVSGLSLQGRVTSPMLRSRPRARSFRSSAGQVLAASPTNPVDDDRTCSVARNDVRIQVEQPHWRQVEWAADLAVQGALTIQRPANWKNAGPPAAWTPQGMFPSIPLSGGGRVPATIMLGVLAQESNLWQASWHALEGVTANPLVGNFYGLDIYDGDGSDDWIIRWSEADCGYGVAQVTDGMRLAGKEKPGEVALPANAQRAVAVDYATNIAAGLRILQQKWNQMWAAGIKINNADPARIENWFAAVWAYNTGVNPQAITGNTTGCTPSPTCTDSRGNWGLGWSNNPANPDLDPTRLPFLAYNPDDARTPQKWPYPEKVIGWAAFPIIKTDFRNDTYEPGYLQAWWVDNVSRDTAKPPLDQFCKTGAGFNNCDINRQGNPCGESDFHCWWHQPSTWKTNCKWLTGQEACGFDSLRFSPGSAEPPGGTHYPPVCNTNGLPNGALIVDDQPDTVPITRPGCQGLTNRGTFGLTFQMNGLSLFPSKIDVHQIGSGVDGHFWFAHQQRASFAAPAAMKVEGTWTLGQTLNQWARVFVHMPSHGAFAQQATYVVDRGASATPVNTRFKTRSLNQFRDRNEWVPLGVFRFAGTPKVTLSNVAKDSDDANKSADGSEDVAWDAIAFQPLSAKPRHFVVALGESYSSGEGAAEDAGLDYTVESNNNGDNKLRNGCHRSRHAWSRQAFLADNPFSTIGQRADSRDPTIDYHLIACSGAQTENLLPANSIDPATGQPWKDPVTGQPWINDWGQRGTGSYREGSQLDKGYLDENTTLVTLSIGGNDVRWSDAVRKCLTFPTPLIIPCSEFDIDGTRATDLITFLIQHELRGSALKVLRAIKQQAPNAKIILMGYPELISNNGDCLDFPPFGISDADAAWMNQMGRDLTWALGDLAQVAANEAGVRVRFADPILNGDFYGPNGGESICGNPETVHAIVLGSTAGEPPMTQQPVSQQSFHPKVSGAANYAQTLNRELRNWGL